MREIQRARKFWYVCAPQRHIWRTDGNYLNRLFSFGDIYRKWENKNKEFWGRTTDEERGSVKRMHCYDIKIIPSVLTWVQKWQESPRIISTKTKQNYMKRLGRSVWMMNESPDKI